MTAPLNEMNAPDASTHVQLGVWPAFNNTKPGGEWAHSKASALKILEEASELVEAFKSWRQSGGLKTSVLREQVINEMADVLQTVANAKTAWDISDEELAEARERITIANRKRPCEDDPTLPRIGAMLDDGN